MAREGWRGGGGWSLPCSQARKISLWWEEPGLMWGRGVAGRPGAGLAMTETNVRYALQQWWRAPVSMSSSSTLTPTCRAATSK